MAEAKSLLEPDFEPDFRTWQTMPSPHTTTNLLRRLQPTIDKGISAHVGQSNPVLKSRAKMMTLQALKTYDPYRAKLSTHVINTLQGLKRVARKQTQIISVPERISLAQGQLMNAEVELQERLGREPTTPELADHTGLSLRRLKQIRMAPSNAMPEGFYDEVGGEEGGFSPAVQGAPTNAYLDLVHGDLDRTNQIILEHSLGLYGKPRRSNQQIAAMLGLTPGAVSQRKAKIEQMIQQQQSTGIFR